jgi:SurA N-terminal domain
MKLSALFLTILCCLTIFKLQADAPMPPPDEPSTELVIYNRILAKVNGKTISVIDVMKRMDLFLQKHYPHLSDSKMARHQFYSTQWQDYLTQMIDTELMLADAEKLEMKISDADVREEILNRFGPVIMPTLDQLALSYEECRQMIHDEMVVQRMQWFRVHSKVLSNVNSQDVKDAYKHYCSEHPELEEWRYQVLSIRSPNKTASELLAAKAFDLLQTKLDLSSISDELKAPSEDVTIAVSPEVQADERTISSAHKEVLKTLAENAFSPPIAQTSRLDNSVVYRIFHLKNHSKSVTPPFEKMAETLKEQLLQEAAHKETVQYILKLRERFGYDEEHMMEALPDDFQPFALR